MACKVKDVISEQEYSDILEIVDSDLPWRILKNKKVMITGASGFIGFYLVVSLLERNDKYKDDIEVIALVRNKIKATSIFRDLSERLDFKLLVQDVCDSIDEPADFIIHAASQASADKFENDPVGTMKANLLGTINVLELARKYSSRVLLISSMKVYGKLANEIQEIDEDIIGTLDIVDYKNCYAQGKRTLETLCSSYVKQYGLDVRIARPGYIYGASSLNDDRVWAQFISSIIKNEDILLKSDGRVYRSFCYVSDTARALFTILLKGSSNYPYNISEEHSNISIRELAKTAANLYKEKNLSLIFENLEDEKESTSEIKNSEILKSKRIHRLGWKAEVDIREGLKRAVIILENKINSDSTNNI